MTTSIDIWLNNQPVDVQAELNILISYGPDPEFIRQLADLLPVVPRAGLIDLYYDIWYCIPSRLAFRFAARNLHDPEKLSGFLVLLERVLVDEPSCAAFDEQVRDDDETYEVIAWLQRRGVA